jgi:two-component system, OmpR family, catabolic regulation response regulator CreB
MARILLVEDELPIADAALYALKGEGYAVEHCLLGRDGVARVRGGEIDVVILDIGLPDMTGFDACREIRAFSAVPVIFLTARDGETDKVLGLELGADDYMVKPFSPRELVARVRARLRRSAPPAAMTTGWQEIGAFAHDPAGQRIRFAGQELVLTRYEYLLLTALLARPGAILSRERLMTDVWQDAPETVDRTVDTHVKTLRSKLRVVDAAADPIQTHRSLGYSLKT